MVVSPVRCYFVGAMVRTAPMSNSISQPRGLFMLRIAAALVFALTLAACSAVDTMTEGFKHAKAVESDLEGSTGVRPQVGFNWNNGRLVSITVTHILVSSESKPLRDLAEAARAAVNQEFKQTPDNIVLAFAVPK